jgi:hypothetical protein
MKEINRKKTMFVMDKIRGYYFYNGEYRKDASPDEMFDFE